MVLFQEYTLDEQYRWWRLFTFLLPSSHHTASLPRPVHYGKEISLVCPSLVSWSGACDSHRSIRGHFLSLDWWTPPPSRRATNTLTSLSLSRTLLGQTIEVNSRWSAISLDSFRFCHHPGWSTFWGRKKFSSVLKRH